MFKECMENIDTDVVVYGVNRSRQLMIQGLSLKNLWTCSFSPVLSVTLDMTDTYFAAISRTSPHFSHTPVCCAHIEQTV